ncbi:MFS transporter [soil metagenome]
MNAITRAQRRNLWLASLGAMLEYYDFVVYIYVAAKIGAAFFPSGTSDSIKLMQTLGIYSLGFVIRPVAGLVIASYADRIGRKRLFIFTVAMMSISTLALGLLPTYEDIGWLAPALLLLLRVIQGCAVGGELPSAGVFVSEHARSDRVGYSGGVLQSMAYGGFLLGASAAIVADLVATSAGYPSLSWRLPFIVGGAFGLIAGYLRRALDETPLFIAARKRASQDVHAPLRVVVRSHRGAVFFGFGIVLVMSVMNVVFFQYWPTLLSQLGHSHSHSLAASSVAIASFMVAMPLWGLFADRFGWRACLCSGATLLALLSMWVFQVLPGVAKDSTTLLWITVPMAIACGALVAPVPGILSSIFPTPIRQSGYAVAYNIGVAAFAGPLPLLLVWITSTLGVPAISWVVLAACVLAVVLGGLVGRVQQFLGTRPSAAQDLPNAQLVGH